MSQAQLHQIKLRLHQAQRDKAAPGEPRAPLPAGLRMVAMAGSASIPMKKRTCGGSIASASFAKPASAKAVMRDSQEATPWCRYHRETDHRRTTSCGCGRTDDPFRLRRTGSTPQLRITAASIPLAEKALSRPHRLSCCSLTEPGSSARRRELPSLVGQSEGEAHRSRRTRQWGALPMVEELRTLFGRAAPPVKSNSIRGFITVSRSRRWCDHKRPGSATGTG